MRVRACSCVISSRSGECTPPPWSLIIAYRCATTRPRWLCRLVYDAIFEAHLTEFRSRGDWMYILRQYCRADKAVSHVFCFYDVRHIRLNFAYCFALALFFFHNNYFSLMMLFTCFGSNTLANSFVLRVQNTVVSCVDRNWMKQQTDDLSMIIIVYRKWKNKAKLQMKER